MNPFTGLPYSEQYYRIQQENAARKFPMAEPPVVAQFKELLEKHAVVILSAETGAAKSTSGCIQVLNNIQRQNGQYMRVCCTQPRKAAAIGLSTRVAQELDVKLGDEVGYLTGDIKKVSEKTLLVYMTEGILLRMLINDRNASKFQCIVIDEAHMRGVDVDILMFLLKTLVYSLARRGFKLVIMSATADIPTFQSYFGPDVAVLLVKGKTFPVQLNYAERDEEDYIEAGANKIQSILNDPSSLPGDVLFFLPGKPDLEKGCKALEARKAKIKDTFMCLQFHRDTDAVEQGEIQSNSAAFYGVDRKVIMSTNVAEASLTIDGIVHVVDCGKAQVSGYDPKTRIKTLDKTWVSQASIRQRFGRSGRTSPGVAHLLYTEKTFNSLPKYGTPAIKVEDVTSVLLLLLSMYQDVSLEELKEKVFQQMLDAPLKEHVEAAVTNLKALNAMDSDLKLTRVGECLSQLPLAPELARALLFATNYGVRYEMVRLAAMSHVLDNNFETVFYEEMPLEWVGDITAPMKLLNAYEICEPEDREAFADKHGVSKKLLAEALKVSKKLDRKLQSFGPVLPRGRSVVENMGWDMCWQPLPLQERGTRDRLVRCLLQGYFMNVAYRAPGVKGFRTLDDGSQIRLREASSDWQIYLGSMRVNGVPQGSALLELKDPRWVLDGGFAHLYMRALTPTLSQRQREIISRLLKAAKIPFSRCGTQ